MYSSLKHTYIPRVSHIKLTWEGQVSSSWMAPVGVSWPHHPAWWCHKSCWGQCPCYLQAGGNEAASAPVALGWTKAEKPHEQFVNNFCFQKRQVKATCGWFSWESGWNTFQRQAYWGLRWSVLGCSESSEETPLCSSSSVARDTCRNQKANFSEIEDKIIFDGFALQWSLYQPSSDRSAETSCPLLSESLPMRPCVAKMTQIPFV